MHITQPRVSDLVNGKVSRFSVDTLINLGAIVGVHMHIDRDATDNEDEAIAF